MTTPELRPPKSTVPQDKTMEDLAAWLRENCAGDDELLELIDALEAKERVDLLGVMREYRLLPARREEKIAAGVDSSEALERLLVELHREFLPIARRHAERNRIIRYYTDRLCGKENLKETVNDPTWEIDLDLRRQLHDLLDRSAQRPRMPFERLKDALNVTESRVLFLIRILYERRRRQRRPPGTDEP